MPKKGYKPTEECRRKISIGLTGRKLSEETKRRMSESHKGKKSTLGKHWKIKDTSKMKGRIFSKTTRKKISDSNKGRKLSKETKKKMSKARIGKVPWNKGKKCPQTSGKNNPNWRGGISFLPYSVDWTEDLKRAIRKRDKYTCQVCRIEPAIQVHHVDYDKKNNNLDNLIILCKKCHGKTTYNRKFWMEFFAKALNLID